MNITITPAAAVAEIARRAKHPKGSAGRKASAIAIRQSGDAIANAAMGLGTEALNVLAALADPTGPAKVKVAKATKATKAPASKVKAEPKKAKATPTQAKAAKVRPTGIGATGPHAILRAAAREMLYEARRNGNDTLTKEKAHHLYGTVVPSEPLPTGPICPVTFAEAVQELVAAGKTVNAAYLTGDPTATPC